MTDSKPKYLTQKEFIRIARKVVREKGRDYRYRDENTHCVYVKNDKPSCLVGQILIEFDPELKNYLEAFNSSRIGSLFEYTSFRTRIDAHPNTVEALGEMQRQQDRGSTWGEALKNGLTFFNK